MTVSWINLNKFTTGEFRFCRFLFDVSTSEEAPNDADNTVSYVRSPLVEIVYLQPSPEAEVYKTVGDKVKKGEVICVIESIKVTNEIKSSVDGTVKNIFVKNEELLTSLNNAEKEAEMSF